MLRFKDKIGHLIIFTIAVLTSTAGAVSLIGSYQISNAEKLRARREISASEASEVAKRWTNVPGIGLIAREMLSRVIQDDPAMPIADQIDATKELLKQAPLYSNQWLTLAIMTLISGGSDLDVQKYLNQSFVTGEFEGWLIFDRAKFAIAIWRILPQDIQDHILTRLMMDPLPPPQMLIGFKDFMRKIPIDVRIDVALRLREIAKTQMRRGWLTNILPDLPYDTP